MSSGHGVTECTHIKDYLRAGISHLSTLERQDGIPAKKFPRLLNSTQVAKPSLKKSSIVSGKTKNWNGSASNHPRGSQVKLKSLTDPIFSPEWVIKCHDKVLVSTLVQHQA